MRLSKAFRENKARKLIRRGELKILRQGRAEATPWGFTNARGSVCKKKKKREKRKTRVEQRCKGGVMSFGWGLTLEWGERVSF